MKILPATGKARAILDTLRAEEQIGNPHPLSDEAAFESHLNPALAGISEIAGRQGLKLPESIAFGAVRGRSVNAHVIPLETRYEPDYLLAFNSHLACMGMLFSVFLATVLNGVQKLTLRYPDEKENDVIHRLVTYLVSQPLIARHFEDGGVFAFRIEVPALLAPSIVPTEETGPLGRLFWDAILAFIVAHEICHLSKLSDGTLPRGEMKQEDVFSEELECDVVGSKLAWIYTTRLLEGLDDHPAKLLAPCGGPLFLTFLSLLEAASYTRTCGPIPSVLREVNMGTPQANLNGVYPTATYRRIVVRSTLQSLADEAKKTQALKVPFELDDWVWNFLDGYWKASESTHIAEWEGRDEW